MAKRVLKGTLGLLLLAAAVWYGWQLGPWSDEAKEYRVPVDFASLERKSTPNQYIVAPPGATPRAQPDAESPVFPVPPERSARCGYRRGCRCPAHGDPRTVTGRSGAYGRTTLGRVPLSRFRTLRSPANHPRRLSLAPWLPAFCSGKPSAATSQ